MKTGRDFGAKASVYTYAPCRRELYANCNKFAFALVCDCSRVIYYMFPLPSHAAATSRSFATVAHNVQHIHSPHSTMCSPHAENLNFGKGRENFLFDFHSVSEISTANSQTHAVWFGRLTSSGILEWKLSEKEFRTIQRMEFSQWNSPA